MEVCVAHARREDLHENVLGSRLRVRGLDELHRPVPLESDGAHGRPYGGTTENGLVSTEIYIRVAGIRARRRALYGCRQDSRSIQPFREARSWKRLNPKWRERPAGRGRSTDSSSRWRSLISSWPCSSAEGSLRPRSFS